MNGKKPTSDNPSEVSLSKESPKWYGPGLERNKILKEGEAKLYIDYQDLYRIINVFRGKIKLTATLLDGSTEIASSYKELDRTTILALIKKPDEPMKFTFDFPPHEIVYGSNLSLVVSAGNETKFARFSFRRNAKLLYGSAEYPSSLTVKFGETDHIKFNTIANPSDEKIVPGGSVKYVLNITSKYDDDLSVDVLEDKEGDWKVTVIDNQLNILAGETAEVHIFANSTENQKKAYGDLIDMTFVVRGKTGIARQTTSAHVLEEAIKYNVNIVDYTKNKNIKKGRNGTFYFIIENNNTGAIDDVDSYTISASSKNNWEIMHTNSINNLVVGEKTGPSEVIVIVSIPKNTSLVSDIITFTVTSDNGQAAAVVNVTVNVIGPTILESIYEFFKSASNSLGFNEMFGSYGPVALGGMLMVIILFIIIILALLLTRRPVKIICTDRIKEIDPDDEAKFEINIENPTYKTQTYEIAPNKNPSSPKWEKSIEPEKVTLERHQSKTVFVTVKPTEFAKPKDWTETKIKVSTLGKKKPEEISTMTMVKEGETLLKITEVFTWPKEFRKGDRVLTSFKLENKGTITARNVDVILYINGKQKNKAVVTIPSGGYADIRMPWIAYKGKNKLYIKVREH
ncbi:MAG: CARDB domain-containing protein [Petrotogales bacterium]